MPDATIEMTSQDMNNQSRSIDEELRAEYNLPHTQSGTGEGNKSKDSTNEPQNPDGGAIVRHKMNPKNGPASRTSQNSSLNDLHPFSQVLSIRELEECLHIEKAFPHYERGSREKVSSVQVFGLFYGQMLTLLQPVSSSIASRNAPSLVLAYSRFP